jgi:N6-adenosine-specific RNA methylase IME4
MSAANDCTLDALVGRGFKTIVADPPWSYKSNGAPASWRPCLDRGEKPHSVNHYYGTMTNADIAAMPIASIADRDSVLFMWATTPLMREAFEVMDAWGWKYKTLLTWEKTNACGMGYWFRGVTEHLLVGVRGKVKAFRSREKNLFRARRRKHSEKPEEAFALIESVSPGPRLELFARRKRERWVCWGNEVEANVPVEAQRKETP